MISAYENRDKLIERYREAIGYVSTHNGPEVDLMVGYEMMVSNATRGGHYNLPEGFDINRFREDYELLFGK